MGERASRLVGVTRSEVPGVTRLALTPTRPGVFGALRTSGLGAPREFPHPYPHCGHGLSLCLVSLNILIYLASSSSLLSLSSLSSSSLTPSASASDSADTGDS